MIATEPRAAAPLSALDRRTLLKGGALGAGLLAAPLSAQLGERGFTHGVASGEPGQTRVLLWSRFSAPQDTRLGWQVSENLDFARIVAEGEVVAGPESDFCCKAWAEGLAPGTWYYYRFTAPDGSTSEVGRTRTLPSPGTQSFRMAVFSCSNIGFGWFNAYAHAAAADEFDCAVHLGDYVYEYDPGSYPSAEQKVAGREVWPPNETVALADYRARFASYRRDPDLRRLHQLYPMISVQDDHESANDAWEGGAENHQPETEGPWSARKAASMRARREWLPISDEPWAEYAVGDLATLFRLETRLTARDKPFDLGDLVARKSGEQAMEALTAFGEGAYRDPAREMLGTRQQDWLAAGLERSKAGGAVWQVLVQQVLLGQLGTPPGIVEAMGSEAPDYVRKRVLAGAMAARAGLPLNLDAWDGYPAARARLYEAALAADANLISLAGDSHNAWAFELAHKGAPIGVEFGGQSVTSPGIEAYLPQLRGGALEKLVVGHNSELAWAESSHRGYMAVELTPTRATCEYRFVENVREKGARLAKTQRVTALAGSRKLAIG